MVYRGGMFFLTSASSTPQTRKNEDGRETLENGKGANKATKDICLYDISHITGLTDSLVSCRHHGVCCLIQSSVQSTNTSQMTIKVLVLLLATIKSSYSWSGSGSGRNHHPQSSRRKWISSASKYFGIGATTVICPNPSLAASDMYKKNPLTNGVLEQIRIWDQAEADQLKYGGELENGDAGNKGQVDAYPRLLLPIIEMQQEIDRIQVLANGPRSEWSEIQRILKQPAYDKIQFKKIFNAYGDNIYYSDPDRANLYLAGGATPKSEQSMAYLLRNEILTNIENLRAEVDFLLQNREEPADDLLLFSGKVNQCMKEYLNMVPPEQLRKAQSLMTTS